MGPSRTTSAWSTVCLLVVAAAGAGLAFASVPLPPGPAPSRARVESVREIAPIWVPLTLHDVWLGHETQRGCFVRGDPTWTAPPDLGPYLFHGVTFLTLGPIKLTLTETRARRDGEDLSVLETLPGSPVAFRCACSSHDHHAACAQFGAACDARRGRYALACREPSGREQRVSWEVVSRDVWSPPSAQSSASWQRALRTARQTRAAVTLAWLAMVAACGAVLGFYRRRADALRARPWRAAWRDDRGVTALDDAREAHLTGVAEELPAGALLVVLATETHREPYRASAQSVIAARAGTMVHLHRDARRVRVRGLVVGALLLAAGAAPAVVMRVRQKESHAVGGSPGSVVGAFTEGRRTDGASRP